MIKHWISKPWLFIKLIFWLRILVLNAVAPKIQGTFHFWNTKISSLVWQWLSCKILRGRTDVAALEILHYFDKSDLPGGKKEKCETGTSLVTFWDFVHRFDIRQIDKLIIGYQHNPYLNCFLEVWGYTGYPKLWSLHEPAGFTLGIFKSLTRPPGPTRPSISSTMQYLLFWSTALFLFVPLPLPRKPS